MRKNVAGQTAVVRAWTRTTGVVVTGDAANITATIAKQTIAGAFGSATATNDANPTHIGGGCYAFDLTQAETNADHIVIVATSATSTVECSWLDLYPRPENNVYIAPGTALVSAPVSQSTITLYEGSASPSILITVVDSAGAAIDVSSSVLRFVAWANGDPTTVVWERESDSGHITVASQNQVTVTYTATETVDAGSFRWALWDVTPKKVLASGPLEILEAAFDA